jgi:hypothetical protein
MRRSITLAVVAVVLVIGAATQLNHPSKLPTYPVVARSWFKVRQAELRNEDVSSDSTVVRALDAVYVGHSAPKLLVSAGARCGWDSAAVRVLGNAALLCTIAHGDSSARLLSRNYGARPPLYRNLSEAYRTLACWSVDSKQRVQATRIGLAAALQIGATSDDLMERFQAYRAALRFTDALTAPSSSRPCPITYPHESA